MQDLPDTLLTGATGLIGRWLVPELTRRKRNVLILIRNADQRAEGYKEWVRKHGGDPTRLSFHEFDMNATDPGLDRIDVSAVRDVYHLAARYEFGLSKNVARDISVLGSLRLLRWSRNVPNLRRFVFITGYLAAAHAQTILKAPASRHQAMIDKHYRDAGAYEASKVEENVQVQKEARKLGIPYCIVNPSAVIGDSATGETTQYIGPGDMVRDLYFGKLPALVGRPDIFVPLVTVDYVARFMARLPELPETDQQSYWLLDQATPRLHDLLARIAGHLGVDCPKVAVPKGIVQALPKALTGVEKETLTFLTNRQYDTANADAIAGDMGLAMPDLDRSLGRWIDHLVSKQFGQKGLSKPGRYRDVAGSRTFVTGDPGRADIVFLHGMPLDSESWSGIEQRVSGPTARADLPGHGRNGRLAPDPLAWTEALMENNSGTPLLVAHSIGCEYALRFAHAHPGQLRGLVLIAPFFIQQPAPVFLRIPRLVSLLVRAMGTGRFVAKALAGENLNEADASQSAAINLSRPDKRQRFTRELARVSKDACRAELQTILSQSKVAVTLVTGNRDPLIMDFAAGDKHIIAGSGHYPQLSEPSQTAAIIQAAAGRIGKG